MIDLKSVLEECSINDIYRSQGTNPVVYQIPIYQRNYAWEREEIQQLIKDIHDSLNKPVYYIGTLVTYKRDENIYEVIDGQQRLTTIYIILKALNVDGITNRLTYSARKKSAATIDNLPNISEDVDKGIVNGYKYAVEGIDSIVGNNKEGFIDYFLNKVHIIHYRVPKDVDLNHYFEVMNSRGEQLEKHEIVKAKFCDKLSEDPQSVIKFSRIWEACSDMGFYIQQKLFTEIGVFGNAMSNFNITSFDDFPNSNSNENDQIGTKPISYLVNSPIEKLDDEDIDGNDKFQPIIDFPNFLLIVLKITRMEEPEFKPSDFTLDDKALLTEFGKIEITPEFAKKIAFNLLKAKYLLDNYVVHHAVDNDKSGENPWKIQYWVKEGQATYPIDLFRNSVTMQQEMVHLQSMFEVAFTPKQRKNYLFYTLLHLFENKELNSYLQFMRSLADKYFYDVYLDPNKLANNQPKANSFDETIIPQNKLNVTLNAESGRNFEDIYTWGSANIPLFVFNYTDYRLWAKYAHQMRDADKSEKRKGSPERRLFFDELGCSDFELYPFNKFYFSRTRKSLEHFYPQAKAGDHKPINSIDINCFGNFAMIGSDANSSGSNWNPIYKQFRYLDPKTRTVSVASLKFRIMLQICLDNFIKGEKDESSKREAGFEWNVEDMKLHQEKMLKIIMNKNDK